MVMTPNFRKIDAEVLRGCLGKVQVHWGLQKDKF